MSKWLSEEGQGFTAQQQVKSNVGQSTAIFDNSLENEKKPGANLDVKQRIATCGETIPIVFGKRVNSKGGVWMQPPLLKTASTNFKGQFLYLISQGEIASSPVKFKTWTGLNNLSHLSDQTIALTHRYSTASALASSPSTCPIQGNGLYCGIDTYSFITYLKVELDAETPIREPDNKLYYYGYRERAVGTGDTSNTTYSYSIKVYSNLTGNDVSAAWHTWLGVSNGQIWTGGNSRYDDDGTLLGGQNPGYGLNIMFDSDWIDGGGNDLSFDKDPDDIDDVDSGNGSWTWVEKIEAINTQTISSNPASTGTLTGIKREYLASPYSDPSNATASNNSSYADITFLEINGDIYPQPISGTFSSETNQVYSFYEEGIKVDLYSSGLSGGNYTKGSSNQFIDLAMYLFTIYKRTAGSATADIATPVYLGNLQNLCTFCSTYGLSFNGIISQSVNIIEFISDFAPYFFLSFLSVGGRYQFAPVLPLNNSHAIDVTALTPKVTFSESNIIPGSFKKGYTSIEDRRDFIASMVYRHTVITNIGNQRTVTVRYPSTSIDAPVEQFDLTAFCSDPDHAIRYAKYEIARRKYSTHNISLETPLLTTELIPTDIIKIERNRISSVGDSRTETEWYQVTSVIHSVDGVSKIEASHFPVNNSSVSLISNEVLNGTFTVLS